MIRVHIGRGGAWTLFVLAAGVALLAASALGPAGARQPLRAAGVLALIGLVVAVLTIGFERVLGRGRKAVESEWLGRWDAY